jgi:hypothetical protein
MAISEQVRARVRAQAQNRCGYCRSLQMYVLGILEIDHIIPNSSPNPFINQIDSMTIPELEAQLLALTPIEKAEAISILTQSLKNSGRPITKTPGVMGGDACIDRTIEMTALPMLLS